MGLHWLSKYGLFNRRRKYTRVLGGQNEEPIEPFPLDPSRSHRQKQKTTQSNPQEWPPSSSHVQLREFKRVDIDLDLDPQRDGDQFSHKRLPSKLLRVASLGFLRFGQPPSSQKAAARIAVDNFLAGPSQVGDEEELHQRQCRELLRRLSARNNRIV
ncbi:hypothetical protein GOP47_0018006 [Adiantum capillus-veneris]|uniref:Uncharacterized protein n=1 Tax=Adiantum capillus-veneris TaxID=13818 RepID=A0A9D4Z9R5_ADICA|nr:hypothetical protein GOP47_0018006 [Adiantum capillus-veneris]